MKICSTSGFASSYAIQLEIQPRNSAVANGPEPKCEPYGKPALSLRSAVARLSRRAVALERGRARRGSDPAGAASNPILLAPSLPVWWDRQRVRKHVVRCWQLTKISGADKRRTSMTTLTSRVECSCRHLVSLPCCFSDAHYDSA